MRDKRTIKGMYVALNIIEREQERLELECFRANKQGDEETRIEKACQYKALVKLYQIIWIATGRDSKN